MTDLLQDTFEEQAVFLSRHDEVVRIVFVIHNVFKVDARHLIQLFKELLVEYERYAADLRHL